MTRSIKICAFYCDTFSGGTEPRRSFLGPCPVIYLSIYLLNATSGVKTTSILFMQP